MIEYEVSLDVDAGIDDDYRNWLRSHVAEILALPGFVDASIHVVEMDATDRSGYCVRYRLRDRDALDAYFRDHAPRLREDGLRRFGDAFRASRRILTPLDN